MSATEFAETALLLAGPRWKSKLGPMIGMSRSFVLAASKRDTPVDETVARLMREMVENRELKRQIEVLVGHLAKK